MECLLVGYAHPDPDVLADLDGMSILRTDAGGTMSTAAEQSIGMQ